MHDRCCVRSNQQSYFARHLSHFVSAHAFAYMQELCVLKTNNDWQYLFAAHRDYELFPKNIFSPAVFSGTSQFFKKKIKQLLILSEVSSPVMRGPKHLSFSINIFFNNKGIYIIINYKELWGLYWQILRSKTNAIYRMLMLKNKSFLNSRN